MDWTTVAVINKSKNTVAALHREYGGIIDQLHLEIGEYRNLVKEWRENSEEWQAYAKRLEAEIAALKAQKSAPAYA